MTSYLTKGLPPNVITSGVRIGTWILGEHIQSITATMCQAFGYIFLTTLLWRKIFPIFQTRILKGTLLLLLGDGFTICANIKPLWDYFKVQPRCQLLVLTFQFPCPLIRLSYSLFQPGLSPSLNWPERAQPQKSMNKQGRLSWGF